MYPMIFPSFPTCPHRSPKNKKTQFQTVEGLNLSRYIPKRTSPLTQQFCLVQINNMFLAYIYTHTHLWCFQRGYPKKGKSIYKWLIWGYPHFRKPPCIYIYTYICIYIFIYKYIHNIYIYVYIYIYLYPMQIPTASMEIFRLWDCQLQLANFLLAPSSMVVEMRRVTRGFMAGEESNMGIIMVI
jgi:hypothetical protein